MSALKKTIVEFIVVFILWSLLWIAVFFGEMGEWVYCLALATPVIFFIIIFLRKVAIRLKL